MSEEFLAPDDILVGGGGGVFMFLFLSDTGALGGGGGGPDLEGGCPGVGGNGVLKHMTANVKRLFAHQCL